MTDSSAKAMKLCRPIPSGPGSGRQQYRYHQRVDLRRRVAASFFGRPPRTTAQSRSSPRPKAGGALRRSRPAHRFASARTAYVRGHAPQDRATAAEQPQLRRVAPARPQLDDALGEPCCKGSQLSPGVRSVPRPRRAARCYRPRRRHGEPVLLDDRAALVVGWMSRKAGTRTVRRRPRGAAPRAAQIASSCSCGCWWSTEQGVRRAAAPTSTQASASLLAPGVCRLTRGRKPARESHSPASSVGRVSREDRHHADAAPRVAIAAPSEKDRVVEVRREPRRPRRGAHRRQARATAWWPPAAGTARGCPRGSSPPTGSWAASARSRRRWIGRGRASVCPADRVADLLDRRLAVQRVLDALAVDLGRTG